RLRAVAALLVLQVLHAARIDSADFGKVLGQITKGNRMEQCPCVRPPEGGACISYDSRYQASHVEEAMISFVDLSLPDRERPTDAETLACTSVECRACFSLLFYRIVEVGLLPASYRPNIPIMPRSAVSASMCPRLRFPSSSEFSSGAAAAAPVAASAAIAGLIERGHRFARAAEAAKAASEAISKIKDEEARHGKGHNNRKKNRNNNNSNNRNNNRNNNNNNSNQNQVQVTAAQQPGQGRTGSTPSPSRQFTVQQQLRVQQQPWQQQQQQAQWQQQQPQQNFQQQQPFQQQQFQPQQQFPNQFNQFNPQQQFSNAAQLLDTARQINQIADTISMVHNRWPNVQPPRPNPGPWPGTNPGPGTDPGVPTHPPGNSGSSEESGGYHEHPGHPSHPHHPHHHHHWQQELPGDLPQPPPPFFGNNAGLQAGSGPPPFPGGPFPGSGGPIGGGPSGGIGGGIGGGHGGGIGGGIGGGGGGDWHFPWPRSARSSPLERRRRAVLASQTGRVVPVEMDVVSPIVSPQIPKELRPEPVEVSFNHDAEHIFSEERSAFAELSRNRRQVQEDKDGLLGSRFTIACFDRGETENGIDDKMISLCGGCWAWRRLPEGFFPPIVNELICRDDDKCLSGWGKCVDKSRTLNVLRKVRGQWTAAAISTGTCCDCKVVAGSEIHSLIVG
ncbi:hypothetical protein PMAYCL1PPCAC_01244, partial [Pristionchus mayeri]